MALLAALLLVLWQGFALVHGVVHPHAGLGVQAAAAPPGPHGDPLHHDDGSSLCRLIDHFAQSDALPATVLACVALCVASAVARPRPAGRGAEPPSHYEARAPPVLRFA